MERERERWWKEDVILFPTRTDVLISSFFVLYKNQEQALLGKVT